MGRTFDQRLKALEDKFCDYGWQVPGTQITRTLVGHDVCEAHGVPIRHPEKECERMWCLALGGMSVPKIFFHGYTVSECLCLAEAFDLTKVKHLPSDVYPTKK